MEAPSRRPPAPARTRATVVVTRPPDRAGPMVEALAERGLDVLLVPSVRIAPPLDREPLQRAARGIGGFRWVAFTSPAGVGALADAGVRPGDVAEGAGPLLAAVGPSTARAVSERFDRPPDLVPEAEFSSRGLADAFETVQGVAGSRVLLPLAEAAVDVLPGRLEAIGARVERVTAYRSVAGEGTPAEEARHAIASGAVDVLTFTSPSTAENFLEAVGREALGVPAAVIGPTTADRARELGYRVGAVAEEHTVEGLVEAVMRFLEGERQESAPGSP